MWSVIGSGLSIVQGQLPQVRLNVLIVIAESTRNLDFKELNAYFTYKLNKFYLFFKLYFEASEPKWVKHNDINMGLTHLGSEASISFSVYFPKKRIQLVFFFKIT